MGFHQKREGIEKEEGKRTGKGNYSYLNGDRYEGDWKENKKHGIGKLVYTRLVGEDKKYFGEYYGFWENGRRHGEGMFTYPNKDIYSGWWKYGKKHGKGTYVFFDTKMRLIGEWSESNLVTGKWVFPNGVVFEGEFKNNKPVNDGTWKFKNGNNLKGKYIQHVTDADEGDEGEEGEEKKPKIKCEWISETVLGASAEMVNSLQNK